MAKQTDINKVIGRLLKDHKKMKELITALDTLTISAYTADMKSYMENKLVKQYHRHVMYMTILGKIKSILGIK